MHFFCGIMYRIACREGWRDWSLKFYLATSQFATKVFAVQRASSDFPVHQSIGLTHRAEYKWRGNAYLRTRLARTYSTYTDLRARGPSQGVTQSFVTFIRGWITVTWLGELLRNGYRTNFVKRQRIPRSSPRQLLFHRNGLPQFSFAFVNFLVRPISLNIHKRYKSNNIS